jgi:nicotinate-nucleotide adenylyltransferase
LAVKDLSGSEIKTSKKKIGFLGGSFNPIHYGHLILAESARVKFNLSEIIFIPSGIPCYYKDETPINSEYRHNMALLAISSNPYYSISRIEIDKKEPSFTVDTIKNISKLYDHSEYEYNYIIGSDQADDLLKWKSSDELLTYTDILVGSRPEYSTNDILIKLKPLKDLISRIHFFDMPMIGISSKLIRNNIRERKSIKYLLPLEVEDYIYKNKLYFN